MIQGFGSQMWAVIQHYHLENNNLITKSHTGATWWTNLLHVLWKHCLELWGQYSNKLNSTLQQLLLKQKKEKIVSKFNLIL